MHVMNTVHTSADAKITALVGLDISEVFDTIEHDVLPNSLESQFGVVGAASSWLLFYLAGRQQFVRHTIRYDSAYLTCSKKLTGSQLGRHSSPMTQCDCGVP